MWAAGSPVLRKSFYEVLSRERFTGGLKVYVLMKYILNRVRGVFWDGKGELTMEAVSQVNFLRVHKKKHSLIYAKVLLLSNLKVGFFMVLIESKTNYSRKQSAYSMFS